jgi:hypothetical protein
VGDFVIVVDEIHSRTAVALAIAVVEVVADWGNYQTIAFVQTQILIR